MAKAHHPKQNTIESNPANLFNAKTHLISSTQKHNNITVVTRGKSNSTKSSSKKQKAHNNEFINVMNEKRKKMKSIFPFLSHLSFSLALHCKILHFSGSEYNNNIFINNKHSANDIKNRKRRDLRMRA